MTIWAIDVSTDRGKTWDSVAEYPAGSPVEKDDAERALHLYAIAAKKERRSWCYRLSAFSKASGDRSDVTIINTPYLTAAETDAIHGLAAELRVSGIAGLQVQDPDKLGRLEIGGKAYACLHFKLSKSNKTGVKSRYAEVLRVARTKIDNTIIPNLDVMASVFPLERGEKSFPQGWIVFFAGAPPSIDAPDPSSD